MESKGWVVRGKLHLLELSLPTNFPVIQIRAAFTHLCFVSRLASSLTHSQFMEGYFLCQSIQSCAGFLKAAVSSSSSFH